MVDPSISSTTGNIQIIDGTFYASEQGEVIYCYSD
jgi:hypothetical protein